MNDNYQIINGPNLNLLGKREPEIYGTKSFEDYFEELDTLYKEPILHYYQSNHEGSIIDKLHDVGFRHKGIILNAGAFTHYSYAIADAIQAINTPVIEVHISDIYAREHFRKISVTGDNCIQIVSGHGLKGYKMALDILLELNA